MERLRKAGSVLVYRCAKQHSEPGAYPHNKLGTKVDEIIRQILDHIEVDAESPRTTPAREPPLWEVCDDAQMSKGADVELIRDEASLTAPDFEVDQRVSW